MRSKFPHSFARPHGCESDKPDRCKILETVDISYPQPEDISRIKLLFRECLEARSLKDTLDMRNSSLMAIRGDILEWNLVLRPENGMAGAQKARGKIAAQVRAYK